MSGWQPVDKRTPRDRPILVKGGTMFFMANEDRIAKSGGVLTMLPDKLSDFERREVK